MLWKKIIGYWKSLFITSIIIYGCLLRKPVYTLPPIENGDKWIHGLAFMVLTIILFLDGSKMKLESPKKWAITICFPIILGGVIEFLQEKFFFPRTGEWIDWLADCIGMFAGTLFLYLMTKLYERRMAQ